MAIQYVLRSGLRIKTGREMAKTPCDKTLNFLAETSKKPYFGVCNKLFQTSASFNYHGTQGKFRQKFDFFI